ncbi:ABC transporter substrate-binding protein [Jeotgalibacillus campisalis]|uniref:Taurine ABC transporter substrate-binding protein n=1 Tax=Jeotgalibacillus campisalis TaxID=220754 RepID=A0A0C2RFZ3_9BACL|nr:ABC transporter substrate-binding protein [Jeotgalibacillus campisalis]KIL49085.1 taurine ABC transporter substrate-binding protein [Jeotgalibacillus campisalis]
MKKWIGIAALLCLLTGCSTQGTIDEKDEGSKENASGDLSPLSKKTTVVVAEDGAASGAGFYIANEKGYFDDYNIEIEFATFANSDDMLPALASGEVDIAGGISSASFFNAIAQGIDVKIVADKGHNVKGKSYFTFVIGADKQDEIKDYTDLKGKKVAVSSQNALDEFIYFQMLEHAGLTENDVEFVLMPDFGNMLAAIENGSIDAALQIEPLITQGIAKGIHVRFGDATDFAPDAQIAMVLGSPDFIGKEKDVSLRFMTAYLKGVRDYNDAFRKGQDKEEIIDIMTQYTALKDAAVWEDVFVTGLNPNGEMYVDNIREQYELYKKNGAIRGEINFDEAIDTDLTEEAVEILGEYN